MPKEENHSTGAAGDTAANALTAAGDKDLAALGGGGDIPAFEELVFRYEKRIAAAAYRLCGDRQEGEDLAQEVFVKAWKALSGYRGQASFGAWLTAILTNLWKDRLRKKRFPQDSLDEAIEGEEGARTKQYPDSSPGPDQLAEAGETGAVLGGMILELQPEFREALILRDVQGFSYEEVAVITGSNIGTVKSRINRARSLMKVKILEYQEQNPEFFRLNQTKKDGAKAAEAEGGGSREG